MNKKIFFQIPKIMRWSSSVFGILVGVLVANMINDGDSSNEIVQAFVVGLGVFGGFSVGE